MTIITTTSRRCGTEFEPDHRTIVAAVWRLCLDCRDGNDIPRGPAICATCRHVLKSGRHSSPCLGRLRRRR